MKGVEGLVELESSMARGESRHKDIGLGAFDGIVMDIGVNGLQDVVSAEAESTDVEGGVGDEAEQMGGVLDGDGGGFVDPLAEFTPEAFEHQFGCGLATWIFGNAGNVQSDTLPFLVTKNVVAFLLEGLTCLLYTSPSPRDGLLSRMPSSA